MNSLDIIVIVLWFIVAAPILAFAALGTLAVLCAPRDELARNWRGFGADLAQEMPGAGGCDAPVAPIHSPPKGGGVDELAHQTGASYRTLPPKPANWRAFGAELAHSGEQGTARAEAETGLMRARAE